MDLIDITKEVYEAKEKERKIYPVHSNRASELGHPCERYLVHSRLDWEKKILPSVETQFVFDMGNIIEKLAKDELEKAGFEIVEQHRPYEWRGYCITGYIDFMVKDKNGFVFPIEVKGLQNHDWDKLNCIEDFLQSKKLWIQKYPAQLTLYMLLSNKEYGAFYIKSKQSLKPKHIWVNLDYTFAEELLQKAKRINEYVKTKTYPERIPYDQSMCGNCPFSALCLQDVINQPAEFIDNQELNDTLDRIAEIKPISKEYDELYDKVKNVTKTVDKLIVNGNWILQNVPSQRTSYEVPEDIKKQYAVKVPVKRLVIEHLTKGEA